MAFSYDVRRQTVFGNVRVVGGGYISDSGSTGGDIETGLDRVELMFFMPNGVATTTYPVVNGDPSGGVVTVVTEANQGGGWIAFGL